jgi:hypothetical protein
MTQLRPASAKVLAGLMLACAIGALILWNLHT